MEDLGHDQQMRREELGPHLVVPSDEVARRAVGLLRRGFPDADDARADGGRVLAGGRAHREAVVEEVEPERVRAEGDLRVARRRDVGVAIPDHRRDAGHLDDDLVSRERRDPGVEALDGLLELLAGHRVKEVPVPLGHLRSHEAQIRAPLPGFGLGGRRSRRGLAGKEETGRRDPEHRGKKETGTPGPHHPHYCGGKRLSISFKRCSRLSTRSRRPFPRGASGGTGGAGGIGGTGGTGATAGPSESQPRQRETVFAVAEVSDSDLPILALGDGDGERLLRSIPEQVHLDRLAVLVAADGARQVPRRFDAVPVDGGQDVADLDPGLGRRAVRLDRADHHAGVLGRAEMLAQLGGQLDRAHAQVTAAPVSVKSDVARKVGVVEIGKIRPKLRSERPVGVVPDDDAVSVDHDLLFGRRDDDLLLLFGVGPAAAGGEARRRGNEDEGYEQGDFPGRESHGSSVTPSETAGWEEGYAIAFGRCDGRGSPRFSWRSRPARRGSRRRPTGARSRRRIFASTFRGPSSPGRVAWRARSRASPEAWPMRWAIRLRAPSTWSSAIRRPTPTEWQFPFWTGRRSFSGRRLPGPRPGWGITPIGRPC